MKRLMTLVGILILVGFVAQPIFAQMHRERDSQSPGEMKRWERSRDAGQCTSCEGRTAGLSLEQREQLRELRKAHEQKTDPIRDQLSSKRGELRDALAAQELDETKVRQLSAEISTLKAELDQARTDHLIQMKKVVPDAQFGKERKNTNRRGGFARCDRQESI